jgi:hypothetical protein
MVRENYYVGVSLLIVFYILSITMKSNADENYKRVEIVRAISCYSLYLFPKKVKKRMLLSGL